MTVLVVHEGGGESDVEDSSDIEDTFWQLCLASDDGREAAAVRFLEAARVATVDDAECLAALVRATMEVMCSDFRGEVRGAEVAEGVLQRLAPSVTEGRLRVV